MTLPPEAGELALALMISAILLVGLIIWHFFGLQEFMHGGLQLAGRHKAW